MHSAPPVHEARDEHHGEHDRECSEENPADDAHAGPSIANPLAGGSPLTHFCLCARR